MESLKPPDVNDAAAAGLGADAEEGQVGLDMDCGRYLWRFSGGVSDVSAFQIVAICGVVVAIAAAAAEESSLRGRAAAI